MGARADARAALAEWLIDAEIVGLDHIHYSYPRDWVREFNSYGSGDHRCHAVIFFEQEGELRFALGGPTSGRKRIDYLVCLELFHRSTSQDTAAAMDDFERIVDEIKTRLREDRRFGADESIVWQGGEGGYGIQLDFERPSSLVGGEPVENACSIRFEITQWITS
jgi:hypothetical protein